MSPSGNEVGFVSRAALAALQGRIAPKSLKCPLHTPIKDRTKVEEKDVLTNLADQSGSVYGRVMKIRAAYE